MPRRARTYLPGYPYHIVQRGNNRDVCFVEPENYQFYLELWQECAARYSVGIHAYCLMTNHVHFMVTPAVIKGDVANIFDQYIDRINELKGSDFFTQSSPKC